MQFDSQQRSLHVPPDWERAAAAILARPPSRILVLGAADVGKSSFCRFLIGRLQAGGHAAALVDGDVGQKDVGPPAAVTLGCPEPEGGETSLAGLYFVGDTSPVGCFLPIAVGLARLVRQAHAATVLVNTSGLIAGPGRALKLWEIEAVDPQLVIGIERAAELTPLLGAFRHLPILRLAASPLARRRSQARRRADRRSAFRRYFAEAAAVEIARADTALQRLPATDLVPNLLCGIADAGNVCAGLGLIESIEADGMRLILRTPVRPERIRALQAGRLRVTADGVELGRISN